MKRISLLLLFMLCVYLSLLFSSEYSSFAQTGYEIEDDLVAESFKEQDLVSLDFKDADLKDVLKVFSQQSGLNFIASKDIEQRQITLYMNDVLIEDALKTLLEANNLTLKQNPGSNILIVKPLPALPIETITRVYRIRYYHGSVGQVGQKVFADEASEKTPGAGPSTGDWDAILRPLLSEYGNLVNHMNLIIITDVPERFKLIEEVINEIDRPIAEVMIEVELIETTADFLESLGVQWGQELLRYQGPATATPFPFTKWEKRHNFNPADATAVSIAGDSDFAYGLMSSSNLSWILEMLETDTSTKFLSKPRILCQDREWAEIKVTADQIVSIKTTRNATSGDLETEVERMEVGTTLKLVPIINDREGFVSLLLEPAISRPVVSRFSSPNKISYIDPNERSLRTVVMVQDGETLAIGGFITTEDQKTTTKVPWLGDIPLIGAFFRHNETTKIDKELLIFITPKIIKASDKVKMWVEDTGSDEEEPKIVSLEEEIPVLKEKTQKKRIEQKSKNENLESVSAPVNDNNMNFREQENFEEVKIGLTLKDSSSEVVDLVK